MFNHIRQLVALAYEGYTDSEGNVFSGDRGSFDITDKFSGTYRAHSGLLCCAQGHAAARAAMRRA